ncbi:hypothetical protein BX666DRAFT_1854633 [Dichotomocladium elegans]|nr:hypothetical protein BX666DRAFT_1854633 [Dichotomocladium elegans]
MVPPEEQSRRPSSVASSTCSSSSSSSSNSSRSTSAALFSQIDPASDFTADTSTVADCPSLILSSSNSLLQLDPWPIVVQEPVPALATTASILSELEANPTQASQIFRRALSTENRRDFYEAALTWSSRTNDPAACAWTARCWLDGWGVERDVAKGFHLLNALATNNACWEAYYPLAEYYRGHRAHKEAIVWYKRAAEESPDTDIVGLAQFRLGELYSQGQDGLTWFERSAQNGNQYGQYVSGLHHERGIGVPINLELAKHYYLLSAEQNYSVAQTALGIILIDLQEYEQGKKWLDRAASMSNGLALFKLGIMYEHGQGVEVNPARALSYYLSAAGEGDHPKAQYILGIHYRQGTLGVSQSNKEAAKYLYRAAKAGYAPAQRVFGLMLAQGLVSDGRTSKADNERSALLWFRRAASQGDVRALCLLGTCYERGAGVAVDFDKAYEHYRRAARMTSAFQVAAQYVTGQLLLRMNRYRDAFDWFKRACAQDAGAEQDNHSGARARVMLARFYLHGWGHVTKNAARAFELLKQSLDLPVAHYWLGACYEEGIPGTLVPDLALAFEHYKMAAAGGDVDGEFQVAFMLANGRGVPHDPRGAFPWYQRAADKGHPSALYSLGLYYARGCKGITAVDQNKARECFERAARKGLVTAMTSLASLYRAAHQTEPMVYWFQKAASLGDPSAQRHLGALYKSGLGVEKNYSIAVEWLTKAVHQKDSQAALLLGSCYQNGESLEVDYEKALALYYQAAQLGNSTGHYAAGLLLQSMSRHDEAYCQFHLVINDPKTTDSMAGKAAKLVLARYALGYYFVENYPIVITDLRGVTPEDAFQMLLELANVRHFSSAYFWLGNCYYEGKGIPIDYVQAHHWLLRAADETGVVDAIVRVAFMYEQGLGVAKDLEAACKYYQQGAEKNHPEAQHKIGTAYWRGLFGFEINFGTAVQWFTRSAPYYHDSTWALGQMALENGYDDVAIQYWKTSSSLGHVPSMRSLAGLLIKTDDPSAMEVLMRAVQTGDPEALIMMGRHHRDRAEELLRKQQESSCSRSVESIDEDEAEKLLEEIEKERSMSIRYYEQAASMGNVDAMFLAAQAWHGQLQFAAALEYYGRAADQGHTLSKVMLARYRIAGYGGIEADPVAGFKILLACAEEEQCVDAYNSLGQCYELGLGTPQDKNVALEWYLRSAEATQDAEAMFRIGQMHSQGIVISSLQPDFDAYQWYHFACDAQNHPRAHYHLGMYYTRGIFGEKGQTLLPPNLCSAAHHFEQAALQEDRDAMAELGLLLLVHEDATRRVTGLAWLERAAQLDQVSALTELGKLHHNGGTAEDGSIGVTQDFEKAYDYFCRAAQQGDPTAIMFIGSYYEHGIHLPPDLDHARKWYQLALQQQPGWWLAELALARLLHQRPETQAEAYHLFVASRDHGSDVQTSAALMVALYELHGWGGVEPQPAKAAQTLLHLAEQGNPNAFLVTAQCFDNGVGLDMDKEKAFEWYSRVILFHEHQQDVDMDEAIRDDEESSSYVEALFRLAEFYQHGWGGVSKDAVKADELYRLAAEQGKTMACAKKKYNIDSSLNKIHRRERGARNQRVPECIMFISLFVDTLYFICIYVCPFAFLLFI